VSRLFIVDFWLLERLFDVNSQSNAMRRKYEIHMPRVRGGEEMGTMSESERDAMMDECFAYDDALRTRDGL
jgi:hypothetical protein